MTDPGEECVKTLTGQWFWIRIQPFAMLNLQSFVLRFFVFRVRTEPGVSSNA
jgi:hypothetical protein